MGALRTNGGHCSWASLGLYGSLGSLWLLLLGLYGSLNSLSAKLLHNFSNTRTHVMHSWTSPQQFVSFDSEWHFARSDFRFEVLHMSSSGSNMAGPDLREQFEKGGAAEHVPSESSKGILPVGLEHRGVTEHVSPGCSATGPQQSDQIHRRVSPVSNDDDDSDGYSDRKNRGSDSDREIPDAITIEYRFPSGENACRSMSISFDRGLSCGHLWHHLRACRVDMDNVKLLVGTQVINEYMKIELLTSVREQLQATPGVLRITVVRLL